MVEITNLYLPPYMEQAKALLTSKTFILAVLQAVAGVIVIFSTAYPAAGGLLMAKSVVDIILRLYTTQPIGRIM